MAPNVEFNYNFDLKYPDKIQEFIQLYIKFTTDLQKKTWEEGSKVHFPDNTKEAKAFEDLKAYKFDKEKKTFDIKMEDFEITDLPSPIDSESAKILSVVEKPWIISEIEDSIPSLSPKIDITIEEPKIPVSISASNTKCERITNNLIRVINPIKTKLGSGDEMKKNEIEFFMEDIKSAVSLSTKYLLENPDGAQTDLIFLEEKITEARSLTVRLTQCADNLLDKERLRKELPAAKWCSWDSTPENYVDFKNQMFDHLEALENEKLKVSTLRTLIEGKDADQIKKELIGLSSLAECFRVLDIKFGNISKFLPLKLNKLMQLKEPRDFQTEIETHNVTEILSYVRICQQYRASENINDVFVTVVARKLREDSAKKLLATRGVITNVLALLEAIKSENESWLLTKPKNIDLSAQRDHEKKSKNFKFNNSSTEKKNTFKSRFPCNICGDFTHKTPYCNDLNKHKTMGEKVEFLKKKNLCKICFKAYVPNHNCFTEYKCSKHNMNTILCCTKLKQKNEKKEFSESETNLHSNEISLNQSKTEATKTCLITEVITVMNKDNKPQKLLCLYDWGATNSTLSDRKATQLYGKKPLDMSFLVNNMSTGQTRKRGNCRSIKIQTNAGVEEIDVFGLEELEQEYEKQTFEVSDDWCERYKLLKNPKSAAGKASLCIGIDVPWLLPKEIEIENGIMLLKSRITNNFILGGKTIDPQDTKMKNMNINRIILTQTEKEKMTNFWSENVDVSRVIKCTKCLDTVKKCNFCNNPNMPESQKNSDFKKLIKENIKFDESSKKYQVSFVYNKNLEYLPTNRDSALKSMKNFESKIEKLGLLDQVNHEFAKFRKNVILLDQEEELAPDLQSSFITLTYSLANNSYKSTKLRLCCNSSYKSKNHLLSLNECTIENPVYLNNLEGILTRWRAYSHCGYNDIASCYHQLSLSDKDKALRRIWVKPNMFGSEHGEPWVEAHATVAQFGDKLAGSLATQCIVDCCQQTLSKENSYLVQRDILMDDLLVLKHSKEDLENAIKEINTGFESRGLGLKSWTRIGDNVPTIKYLSYLYCPKSDTFKPKININYTKVKRGARSGRSLISAADLDEYINEFPLRKSSIASLIVGTCHDPLGISLPYLMNLKFLFRKLIHQELGWDDLLKGDNLEEAKRYILLLFNLEKIQLPRQALFFNAKKITFQIFFDGSLQGIACTVLVKNQFQDGRIVTRLLKNKAKVTSHDCNTTPRSELLSALISSRLYEILKSELKDFIEEFQGEINFEMIGDSTIVLSQIQKHSYLFKSWVKSRVFEIQRITDKLQNKNISWHHCPGSTNVADVNTRPFTGERLPWESDFNQNFCFPEFNGNIEILELPEHEKKLIHSNNISLTKEISLNQIILFHLYINDQKIRNQIPVIDHIFKQSSKYFKSVNILARILFWKEKYFDKNICFSQCQDKATLLIVKHFQGKHLDQLEKFKGHIYYKEEIDDVIYLRGRETLVGQTKMYLIPKNCKLFNQIASSFHRKYEGSVNYIQAQIINAGFYMPALTKKLISIQKKCPRCRRKIKKAETQKMGMIGSTRLFPNRPFFSVQMDLAGPFFLKHPVNKRKATSKIWLLLTICNFSRFISVAQIESLSTEHLLATIQAQFYRFGKSTRIESDFGSNLTKLKKLFEENENKNDSENSLNELTLKLQTLGCSLIQRAPRAPWIQGSAEFAVKMTKKALNYCKTAINPIAFQQLLEKVMFIVNSRPLGLTSTGETFTPLSINPIFSRIDPTIEHENIGILPTYLEKMEKYFKQFEQNWFIFYKKNLLAQKKWIHPKRNLKMNDCVLILDLLSKTGYPRLAKIIFVKKDTSGTDRYFHCRYKDERNILRTVIRTPQSLCLILSEEEINLPQNIDMCDYEGENYDTQIFNPSNKSKSKIKVKVQNEPTFEIKDIKVK